MKLLKCSLPLQEDNDSQVEMILDGFRPLCTKVPIKDGKYRTHYKYWVTLGVWSTNETLSSLEKYLLCPPKTL